MTPDDTSLAAHGEPPRPTASVPPVASDDAAPSPQLADAPPAASPGSEEPPASVDEVRAALRRVKDPELNLNIVDLGLVYEIAADDGAVKVDMSLTSPGCPSGPEIMRDAENAVKATPGVRSVAINLVWSPMWTPDRIEPRVRTYLGF